MFGFGNEWEFECLVEKSRTMWLNQDELKKLIEIRDSNTVNSNLAGLIIDNQRAKMCGEKIWR